MLSSLLFAVVYICRSDALFGKASVGHGFGAISLRGRSNLVERHEYKNVFDVVQKFEEMPPCNKIATSMLMRSCLALDDGQESSQLEGLSTLYATRLAICELLQADVVIPKACEAFTPSSEMVKKVTIHNYLRDGALKDPTISYHAYDKATALASRQCTKSLHSKPQWWTSFSNSKQNSMAICQAVRAEIQRDEMVDRIEAANRATNDIHDLLLRSTEKMETLNSQMDNLRKGHDMAQDAIHRVAQDLETTVVSTHGVLNKEMMMTQLKLAAITSNIEIEYLATTSYINDVFRQIVNMSQETSVLLGNVHGLQYGFEGVNKHLNSVTNNMMSLDTSSALVSEHINGHLSAFNSSIDLLSTKVEAVSAAFALLTDSGILNVVHVCSTAIRKFASITIVLFISVVVLVPILTRLTRWSKPYSAVVAMCTTPVGMYVYGKLSSVLTGDSYNMIITDMQRHSISILLTFTFGFVLGVLARYLHVLRSTKEASASSMTSDRDKNIVDNLPQHSKNLLSQLHTTDVCKGYNHSHDVQRYIRLSTAPL